MDYSQIWFGFALCLWILDGLTATVSEAESPPCKMHETLTCGDNDMRFQNPYAWYFCKPKTHNYKRIVSVQLDLRYTNRYCRYYSAAENFGLSEDAQTMWVVNMCQGTFFLCLEIEKPTPAASWPDKSHIVTTTTETGSKATQQGNATEHAQRNTNISSDPTNSTQPRNATDDSNDAILDVPNTTNSTTDQAEVLSKGTTGRTTPGLDKDRDVVGDDTASNTTANPVVNAPNRRPDRLANGVNNQHTDSELTKVWMVMGIVIGGFILLCLIVTIFFLAIHRDNDGEQHKFLPRPRRSRNETVSTSMLLENSSDAPRPSVYDLIPITELQNDDGRCTGTPEVNNLTAECGIDEPQYMELPNVTKTSDQLPNIRPKFTKSSAELHGAGSKCTIGNIETEREDSGNYEVQRTVNPASVWTVHENTECSKRDCDNNLLPGQKVHFYHRLHKENEYDHLLTVQRPAVLTNTTYSKLYQFRRNDNSDSDPKDNSGIYDKAGAHNMSA